MGCLIIFVALLTTVVLTKSTTTSFGHLFPLQNRLYTYAIRSNVATGTVAPNKDGSFWTMEGRLSVQVYDDFTRARFQLDNLTTLVHGDHGNSTHQSTTATELLMKPWEVGVCFNSIHVPSEPVWVTNMKRALSFNFLHVVSKTPKDSFTSFSEEPCLYGNCVVIYFFEKNNKTRKYISAVDFKKGGLSAYEANCLPAGSSPWYGTEYADDPRYIITSERVYEINELGLRTVELSSDFQYKIHDQLLGVSTKFSLHYESDSPAESVEKLNLTEVSLQYVRPSHSFPTNGILNPSQDDLKSKTYDMLLKIAKKGIDADNIVRNASLIHSLDFVDLLTTMSQLNYTLLTKLFEDMLGTSYELETSRNIFLEVLPYVRTDAAARLIRYLVIEQKSKIEDSMLLSLIRKLPFNIIHYSKNLLEELETLTKLGPEYSQELRHAGILSFAAMVYRTMEESFDQQYFDDIYDKYLRMYNNCPQYIDRLVWLQGLTNIGKNVVNYLDEIHTDLNKDRHERLWAALASLSIWKGSYKIQNVLPILRNDKEHIQLRALALHAILSSRIGSRDFMNIHNYIQQCDSEQLKRFWYSSVKNMEGNKYFSRYKPSTFYVPFVASQLPNPDLKYWATFNYIVSQEPRSISFSKDVEGPAFQLLSIGEESSGLPEMVALEFSTGGEKPFMGGVYIVAEGVSSNIYSRMQNFNMTNIKTEHLLEKLMEMKVKLLETKKVHIDIVIKIQDKTVYATHIDQTRFETLNEADLKKSIEDFVRFGSHINQQMVYYPIQSVRDFPTEIGTPIRLQSNIVSFTSIRGNLTAPSTDDLTWRNDLHLRYQGTSMTSLTSYGPLQPSEHAVKVQQTVVLHLPIKLDVSYSTGNSFDLNPEQWDSLYSTPHTEAKSGFVEAVGLGQPIEDGILCGPTLLSEVLKPPIRPLTRCLIRIVFFNNEDEGIYFDCEHPLSISEISQLLTSRNYDILSSLRPSEFILNSIRLISSPTFGTCGFILPPKQLGSGNKLKLQVHLDEFAVLEQQHFSERVRMKVSYLLSYYREQNETVVDTYLAFKGSTAVESDGHDNNFAMDLQLERPQTDGKNWTFCVKEHHNVSAPAVDYASTPASLDGSVSLTFSNQNDFSCTSSEEVDGRLKIVFRSEPQGSGRSWQFKVSGKNIPRLPLERFDGFGQSPLVRFLKENIKNFESDAETTNYIELEEVNEATSVSLNDKKELFELKTENLEWFPHTWTSSRLMKKLGLYHECQISDNEVHTFYGDKIKLSPHQEILAVGECASKPRFAVFLHQNQSKQDVFLYTGDDSVSKDDFADSTGILKANDPGFRTVNIEGVFHMRSKVTGVNVYQKDNRTWVLVPYAYMDATCGVCSGDNMYFIKDSGL